MGNCPVCDAVVGPGRKSCGDCGTPLGRNGGSSGGLFSKVFVLIPGLSHLWKGYLTRGVFALLGTFLLVLSLGIGVKATDHQRQLVYRLMLWGILYLVWIGVWYWDSLRVRTVSPSPGRIVSIILILLFVANGLMVSILINVFLGGPY